MDGHAGSMPGVKPGALFGRPLGALGYGYALPGLIPRGKARSWARSAPAFFARRRAEFSAL